MFMGSVKPLIVGYGLIFHLATCFETCFLMILRLFFLKQKFYSLVMCLVETLKKAIIKK